MIKGMASFLPDLCGRTGPFYNLYLEECILEIDLVGLKPMIGMPIYRDMSAYTAKSLALTIATLTKIGVDWALEMEIGSALVHHARSKIANTFLKSDSSHLFWIDADMVWQPNDMTRLLALTKGDMDCISVGYTEKNDNHLFQVELDTKDGQITTNEFGCLPIKAAGLGFTIMSRSLVQALADISEPSKFFDRCEEMVYIFRTENVEGKAGGEDILMFKDIRKLGFQPWLDPTVNLGHVGTKVFNGCVSDVLETNKVINSVSLSEDQAA
jgi:hypothetical protein